MFVDSKKGVGKDDHSAQALFSALTGDTYKKNAKKAIDIKRFREHGRWMKEKVIIVNKMCSCKREEKE